MQRKDYGNLNNTTLMVASKALGLGVEKQLQSRWEKYKALPVWGFKRAVRFLLKCKTSALIFDRNWGDDKPEPWDTGYAIVDSNTESGCNLDAKLCWVSRQTAQALKDYRAVGRNEYGGYRKRAIYARNVEGCRELLQSNFLPMRRHTLILSKAKRANLKLANNINQMGERLEAFGVQLAHTQGGGNRYQRHPSVLYFYTGKSRWHDSKNFSIDAYRVIPREIAKSVENRLKTYKEFLKEK